MTNLQLSESYYAVLKDLERQHAQMGRTIEIVSRLAQAYSEAAMREKQPNPVPQPDPATAEPK